MLPPLPIIAPLTADIRLAYVLQHFRLAFPAAPEITIGYTDAHVQIVEGSGQFFAQTQPYPPAPNQREWRGQSLPFFFDAEPAKPLLELLPQQRVLIHADIISAAFYLLSGWQEFFSEERDRHGRFPYAASVQQQYGFVAVPVVNYYFDVLKTAVEHATGVPLRQRRWAHDAPFAAFITHDIDNLRSAWKAPAKSALQRRDWRGFGQQLWRHYTQPDAWDNLALVRETVAAYGAKSTFFFLPEHRPGANGTPNADYSVVKVWPRIAPALADSEVGLHGSIGRAVQGANLKSEEHRLQACLQGQVAGIRFHYLGWEPRITPGIVHTLRLSYDSTLGFAEHFGFRNSYCHPFQPFDFSQGQAYDFLEIPLNVMDATLYHPNYLKLAADEILPALQPLFEQIERFGGVCTVLWHNENFDPANEHNGPQQFHTIMEYLRSRRVAFVNGQDICATVS
ncbi:DUF7033 domain-containing protein [Hymenobacter elongatus]|uniref:DUF7033 domain-containing protein n=1 Tax=Hymenobacter elongatus TaxID=877208 RepID=A0A4Z0PK34_9BACT|nr:hypothetical protein [Hymenobacter elongatus]TGE15457.1 hypothetical protein E5J99_12710 [Hymenobacter elongatus]